MPCHLQGFPRIRPSAARATAHRCSRPRCWCSPLRVVHRSAQAPPASNLDQVKQPVFLLDTSGNTPDQAKQRAREALAAFTQVVEATHDEQPADQH